MLGKELSVRGKTIMVYTVDVVREEMRIKGEVVSRQASIVWAR